MRTTISVDDDTIASVKQYARDRQLSLTKAFLELVRRGLESRRPTKLVNGMVVFDLPPDSPVITTEDVRRLELDLE